MIRSTLCLILFAGALSAEQHQLKASPETVVVGHYWSESKPVLIIKSGDTVTIETVGTANVAALERLKVPADQIPDSLRAITAAKLDRGPGGHINTGPIYIEGAEPGDVLELHIDKITLPVPWAYNGFRPTSGFLKEDFQENYSKLIPLDRDKMTAHFNDTITIPLHPFFGSMGVAPPVASGRLSSAPPGTHAGNLDNRNLVAGTILYIPVHVKGALFQVGDGHAGQGDGEVDITAMETPLVGTFRFVVRKDMHLKWPRAETPTHYIVMGTNEDLTLATQVAVREMIDYLSTVRGLSKQEAYVLSSIAADFEITQLVDGNKGVHGMIAKSIFGAAPAAAAAGSVPSQIVLKPEAIAMMPHQTISVPDQNGTKVNYQGVPLRDVLKQAGVPMGKDLRGKAIASYIVAKAHDGYQVVSSLGEIDEAFGNGSILIADKREGKALFGYRGPLRLVCPNDKAGSRSVRMLETIDIVRLQQ